MGTLSECRTGSRNRLGVVRDQCLEDPSELLQPQVVWDVASDWQFILGAPRHWGADGSEFGGFEVDVGNGALTVGSDDRAYLWLTYYL